MKVNELLKRKVIRALAHDSQGTTALELALILPVLLTVLIGIIELSMAMFINTVVEGSLKDASRLGLTGQIQAGVSNAQAIVDMINNASLGLLNLTAADVTTKVYPNFAYVGKGEPLTYDANGNGKWDPADGDTYTEINGNGTWDEDLGVAGLGTQGDIVLYTVKYNWNFLSGKIIPVLDGIIPMSASIVVRNEPY